MNSSGQIHRSPATSSGSAHRGKVTRHKNREIDLWLEILETLRPVTGALDVDEIAEVCNVSPTCIYQYQSSGMEKLRSGVVKRGLTIHDVRRGLAAEGVEL